MNSKSEEILIDNLEVTKVLFQYYRIKEGEVVTLFYKDKTVEQKNSRSALARINEEFPDLTREEVIQQQKELLAQIRHCLISQKPMTRQVSSINSNIYQYICINDLCTR